MNIATVLVKHPQPSEDSVAVVVVEVMLPCFFTHTNDYGFFFFLQFRHEKFNGHLWRPTGRDIDLGRTSFKWWCPWASVF